MPSMDLDSTNVVTALWTVERMDVNNAEFEAVNETDGFEVDEWIFAGRNDWSEEDMNIDIDHLKQWLTELRRDVHHLKDQVCIIFTFLYK